MTCNELLSRDARQNNRVRSGRASATNLQNYTHLHPEGQQLIAGWFRRAWQERDCQPENSFEPFIFAWIAFNGWAACVTGLDSDREYLDALMLSQVLQQDFTRLVADPQSAVQQHANNFHQLWPVFKAQRIRRQGVNTHYRGNRQAVVQHYLANNITDFEPQCYQRHIQTGQAVSLDWPHTLAVLYRVRCNLFHGEKAVHSEMDRLIVSAAFRVLVTFVREAGYI